MPVRSEETKGPARPQINPYWGPHIIPQSSTGRCMGENRIPPLGIKWNAMGSTTHRAMHTAVAAR